MPSRSIHVVANDRISFFLWLNNIPHIYTHIHIYVYTKSYIYTHIYIHLFVHSSVHGHIICFYVSISMCIYCDNKSYIYMYTYIYTYFICPFICLWVLRLLLYLHYFQQCRTVHGGRCLFQFLVLFPSDISPDLRLMDNTVVYF